MMTEEIILFSSIEGNTQKLDGGAMFGNAPKELWKHWIEPDENNRIQLACRALLIETSNVKILIETGIGAYMKPKLQARFGIHPDSNQLVHSLASLGLNYADITHIILSHLHFDHAGGLLSDYDANSDSELLFPNATFLVGEKQWERANNPHPRDRASYIPRLHKLLNASGRLKLLRQDEMLSFGKTLEISFYLSSGHTPGMLCPRLKWDNGELIFVADLIPGLPWIHAPITMGYDRFPEILVDEKSALLEEAALNRTFLFFTHDPETAVAIIDKNEKGRYYANETINHLSRTHLTRDKNDE